ncbi:MAG: HlyC/CorC family transporter [Bacteroidales bacterium]|nr:HlyC/CorC family transporter [Bacteroidales bacterium]MBN2750875.1 HlyC/CorC family transporter [Bacteroidales bacterium]
MGSSWTLAVLAVLGIFFSVIEYAYIHANRLRLELDKKQGSFASKLISAYSENSDHFIATLLLGKVVVIVLLVGALFLSANSISILTSFTPISKIIISIALCFGLAIMVEVLPKQIALLYPNQILNILALPFAIFYIVLYPVVALSIAVSKAVALVIARKPVTRKGLEPLLHDSSFSEFISEVHVSPSSDEPWHEQEIRMFQNALDFTELKVRDCLIPRTDIEAIDINSSVEELREKVIDTYYSRIPVFQGSIDNIIGYINSKDLFKKPQSIRSRLIRIDFIPETMRVNKLLTLFIKEHKNIAVVVDEFGGTAGLVTTEDLIEQIFGDIDDEHDNEHLLEKQLKPNEFVFSGRLDIEYLNEEYALNIPESEEYDTLAGYVLTNHQSIPLQGEGITIGNFRVKVLKMDGTRIEAVHIVRLR